jgi:MraZ protein
MFRGRYQHTIDPKGRLSVPSKYRDVLAQYDGSTLVAVPNEQAIEMHPLEEWERIETKINERSMFDLEIRKLGRLYVSRAKEVELDGAGRILLPPDTRHAGALQRDVTLIGLGRKYFEIWDRVRFDEYERVNMDALATGFERLSQLGV